MTALLFDCDGVLGDTERDGHLPAFNATFEQFGLPVRWSVEDYGRLLRIGGGKERLATLLDDPEVWRAAGSPATEQERAEVDCHVAPCEDGGVHEAGRRRGDPPATRRSPGDHRGPGCGLDRGGGIHLGRAVGARRSGGCCR